MAKTINALIFGAGGQDGYYLSQLCQEREINPIAVSRSSISRQGDVSDYAQVEQLVRDYAPGYIFHLAAKSSTRHNALWENHGTISTGTLNILEAAKKHCPGSKIFITGSGVQFVNQGNPISEDDEFCASSPYAVSRIHSVYAARYYRSLGLKTYVGYLFHHESPLRKPSHLSQSIALAVRRIAQGSEEVIEIGDLSVEKEWTFAGDVAMGILTLVEQEEVFEAAIGSGLGYSIKDWLEQCFTLISLDWQDRVRLKGGFIPEYQRLISNPQTIYSLGWSPQVNFSDLAAMMINDESDKF